MMIISYSPIHYGKEYLADAIRSVIDYVDEYWVLYTDQGSHGTKSSIPCPETEDELRQIADSVAGRKLRWVSGRWSHEGSQRDAINTYCPDADIIIPLDSDEVWQPGLLDLALQAVVDDPFTKRWLIPFRHYWRSFYRCILHDPAYPVRLINNNGTEGTTRTLDTVHNGGLAVNHFGYAQSSKIVEYKLNVHGHKNEFRKDCDWFKDIFMQNVQVDCHPVGSEFWTTEVVEPFVSSNKSPAFLPNLMTRHKYAQLEVIP